MSAGKNDIVVLSNGDYIVTDVAEFDNLIRVEPVGGGKGSFIIPEQILWNRSETKFTALDSHLMQDYS